MSSPETTPPQGQKEEPPKEESQKHLLQDIVFAEMRDKKNKIIGYRSADPRRKGIELSEESQKPTPGMPYDVEVLRDTKPDDPLSGKLIVKIVPRAIKYSPEEWKEVERRVEKAEESERMAHRASRDIYRKTGLPREERRDRKGEEIISRGKKRDMRVLEIALEREELFEGEVEEILGGKESPERAFVRFREKTLRDAIRDDYFLRADRRELLQERAEILRGTEGPLSGAEREALQKIEKELKGIRRRRGELLGSSPEAYFGLHILELKRYRKELDRGRIVETPYVEEHIDDIRAHFRRGEPILIYGHLGSGKTELALHFAKKEMAERKAQKEFDAWLEEQKKLPKEERAGEKEAKKLRAIWARHQRRAGSSQYAHEYSALFISGSKNTGLAELYGHTILDTDRINKGELDEYAEEVGGKYREWVRDNAQILDGLSPEEQEAEKNRAHDRILQTYLTQFKEGTVSRHFLGPIYKAMEEGRPVIIDEANAIPHEVLISLNHALTRRPGETVRVQKDAGKIITVEDGYGVIMTGNLNQGQERYVDRQDMDPAFLSRIYKVPYDYLPQKIEGWAEDEAGPENELFHLMLAEIMDKNGNIETTSEIPAKLWFLAQAARVTQNVFSGREVAEAYYFRQSGATPLPYILQEQVLSLRALERILKHWQKDEKDEYQKELDYYIWSEFISQSTVPEDRAYLYQLFKDRFPFFSGSGWEQNPNYGAIGNVPDFSIKPPKNPQEGETVFLTARDVVELAYGKAPERARWPK